MPDETVKITWYCGHYFGPPKWHGDFFEPEDCGTVFETEEDKWKWEEGDCSAKCPRCHAELWQKDDYPELTEGKEPSIPQHKLRMILGEFE